MDVMETATTDMEATETEMAEAMEQTATDPEEMVLDGMETAATAMVEMDGMEMEGMAADGTEIAMEEIEQEEEEGTAADGTATAATTAMQEVAMDMEGTEALETALMGRKTGTLDTWTGRR